MIEPERHTPDERAADKRTTGTGDTHDTKNVNASPSRWRTLPLIVMTMALGAATVMLWSMQQTPEPSPVLWQESGTKALTAPPADRHAADETLRHEPSDEDENPGNDATLSPPSVTPQRTPAPPSSVDQTMRSMLQQSLSPSGQVMTDQEPAGLRPIESGRRISGFVQTQGGFDETFSVWEVASVSVEQVIAHYDRQARDAGFVATKTPTRSDNAAGSVAPATRWLVTYTRSLPATRGKPVARQTLTIRVQGFDDVTRVTLWLGQPSAKPVVQPSSQPPAQSQPGAIR